MNSRPKSLSSRIQSFFQFKSKVVSSRKRSTRQAQLEQLEARRVMAAAILEELALDYSTAENSSLVGSGEGEGGGGSTPAKVFYYSPSVAGFVKNSNHSKLYVDDSDIVKLQVFSNGSWTHQIYFDGSDVGLASDSENVDAFSIRPDGSLLFSTVGLVGVPGASGNGEDLLRFRPTKLGDTTTGTWEVFFDGSDVGLSTWEGLDGVSELPDGRLILSVGRQAEVNGLSGKFQGEDLLSFKITTSGSNTSGVWAPFFDGSDVHLDGALENVDGVSVDSDGNTIHLSTTGLVRVPGLIGFGRDIFTFEASQLGSQTVGVYDTPLTLNGSHRGLLCNSINAIHIPSSTIVNLPPVIASVSSPTIPELALFSRQLSATDPDTPVAQLAWSLVSGPSGAQIGASTGLFTWTPTESQGPGVFPVIVAVTDGTSTAQATFSISVTEVNQPPVLAAIANQTIDESTPLTVQVSASDADLPAQTLTYSLGAGAPAGAAINSSGSFSWTPTEANGPGVFTVPIVVTDSLGATATRSFTITVREVNQPPAIAAIANQTIDESTLLTLQVSASDADLPAQALTYSLGAGAPAGAAINSTGGFSWTPTEANGPGVFTVPIVVTDALGATATRSFTITVREVNQPPVLAAVANQTIDESTLLALQVSASDADLPAQALTYSLGAGAPAGASISSSGSFSWTPTEANGPGVFTVPIVVTDALGATATGSFTVTVREVNQPPVLAPINNQSVTVNQLLIVTAQATDPDLPANTLTYSLTTAPASATINAQTGQISWLANTTGNSTFTVQVADQGGLTSSQTFQVTVNGVELRELDDFSAEYVQTLTLPNASSSLRVDFQSPTFDTTSQQAIRDAFEIELMDLSGNPLVLPYASQSDASYNVTEGLSPVAALGVVTTSGGVGGAASATINLSGLAAGTQFQVRMRLVNNDSDNGTIVRINNVAFVNETSARPAGISFNEVVQELQSVDFRKLDDVTGSFQVAYGRTSLAAANNRLLVDVQLQNRSTQSYRGPVLMVIKNLSSLDANALRPDGFTPAGDPYFQIELSGEAISTGQNSIARQIGFLNRSNERFDYELQILAALNSAPSNFSTSPLTSIQAGNLYSYTAQAVDRDGDSITYSIVTGPSSAVINPSTGQLTWNTTSEDLGSHDIMLVATDPYGLSVEQSFAIQVVESLQNRPPVFVSIPGTEAIAGSGFEVSTVQAGGNPVGVAVANIGLDDGTLVTINRGNQTLSQIAAIGNDRYELPLELTVGEPGPIDQILRSGYNIDVGLPRYTQQFEGNSIRGMDQADLNGDGLLDIVIMAQLRQDAASFFYTQVINVVFGEGDGKFSEPVNLSSITTTGNSNPRTLRLADFDQDGSIDILALNVNTSSLYLLRGAGDGAFSPVQVMPIAVTLNDFKTVDLNRDGVLDLIGATSDTRSLGYMLGNGDGTFANYVAVITATNSLYSSLFPGRNYAVSDMDADGDIDIVYTNFTAGTVNVLTNDGSLNFTSAVSIVARRPFGGSVGASVYSVFVGDFNGDALVDIAYGALGYTSNNTGSLGMFIRNSSGFTYTYQDGVDAIAHHPGNWAGNSDPVDIDGDGDLDLIVGGVTTSNFGEFASVLRNHGNGTFAANNISLPFTDNSDYEAINRENDTKGMLAGDYNSDGMLDLITFRSADSFTGSAYSTVSVVLADRPGEFASSANLHYDYLANAPQRFFESGDFNNDGIVDLWSPRYQSVSRTWLGKGDGTFNAPIIATPDIGNEFLSKGFTGDFDKDGNLDIFWLGNGGVQGGPTSRLLAALGNGDGSFTRTFTLPYSHSEVFPADFNGDGYIDFATRNFGTALDVFLYDVENPGTWRLESTFAFSSLGTTAGDYRATLSVDDFNEDGNLDLAAAYRLSGGDPQIAVLPGVGNGTFGSPISTAYSVNIPNYNSPAQFSSGDLNEDGIADLVVYDSSAVGVHLGVGDGTFGTATVIPANDPRQLYGNIFIKDFDYDGLQDILFTDTLGAAQLHFLRGRGDGTFEERISYDPAIDAGYVEFGDLDNDGRDEVILSEPNGTNFATILYAARERLTDIVTADLNGDGNDDVLTTNFDNSRVKWFLGDNLGGLTKQPDLLTANGPVGLVATDLDQDSTNEIITVNRSDRSVSIFSADGTAFTRSDVSVGRTPIAVTAALVDADVHQDLLVLDGGLNTVWYLSGNNDLTFAAPVPILLGDRPNDLLAGDINGDGFTDIVVSLPDSNRLMILPGDGAGNFAAPTYIALPGSPTAIGISDFNQDGRTDIAGAIGDSDEVLILYGRGQLQFARPQAIRVGDQPASLTIDDADGDGRDDIIVANSGDDTASVIFNRFDPTKVYRYDALAIDPDNDVVAYDLVDAPGGLILNAETGQILWAPSAEQIGLQSVTIAASDGRGGISTQSFNIDVVPARENSAPLIGSLPQITIGADEAFTYSVKAADTDNDSLRYRLLDGPDGATIDPISGLVTWDARLNAARLNEFSQVSQHFIVPATAALQPASVTAEGWFKFEGLSSNETLIRKTNGFSGSSYQLSFVGGILRATVGANTSSSGNVFVTYNLNREVGRWYHFAMSFDDVTKQLSLFVDGQQVATTTANLTIGYENDTEVFIAGPSTKFNGELGMVRIWKVARPPALLQQSMSSMANSSDPTLVLDLDFSSVEAQTMRDKSSYQHVAVRSGTGNVYPKPTSGLAFAQAEPFVVSVEDGRGGYDQQSFEVTYVQPLRGNITGKLFDDQSGDGLQQVGEPALVDWVVYQDLNGNQYPDPQEPSTRTNSTGRYTFGKQLPGAYPVRVQPRSGFETPTETTVNVVANQNTIVDFALNELALGQIRGQVTTGTSSAAARWKVFADLDDSGVFDTAEPFALTDDLGQFAIAGLNAGDYRVRVEMLPGWQVTNPANRVLDVTLATNAIAGGNDFVVSAANTTAASGLQFVTTPNLSGASDSIVAGVTYRYDAVAIGLLNQTVTYDLSLAPEGMSIDPATGLIAWRPTIAQVGEHLVVVRATSASGSIALQEFTLNVTAPNTAPTLTTDLPGTAYVGLIYAVDLAAQDAESQTITYGLLSGPSSATLNAATGQLRWTPTLANVGNATFSIELRDSAGGVSIVNATVAVVNSQPVATPFNVTLPRTQVGLGQEYFARIRGTDALGRPLTWSLVTGPAGLLVSSNGTLTWTPGNDDVGSQPIVLQATNVAGTTSNSSFTLQVAGRQVNTAPVVTSTPIVSTTLGKQYQYDVQVLDSDADALSFALFNAPVGMSIHPSLGTILWTPAVDQLGESDVSVQVTDPDGATATQEFKIKVSKSGGPPAITSVPPTEASVGTGYLYSIAARDAEGDPLNFRLLAAPAGMTIAQTTGVISWTPQAGQVGQQDVVIEVSDGVGGAVTQAFVIRVSTGVPNLPPVIGSTAPRFGAVGTAYGYTMQAADPEATTITYSLGQAPVGMTINASSGVVAWTPTASQVGRFVVTLIATDAGGAKVVESFELDVLAANSQPTIISTAPVESPAGAVFTYQVLGRDTDLDQLTYQLTTAPAGATIDSFGKITWPTTPALIGPHNFAVRVSDPRGGVATQSFTLSVIADLIAPKVSLVESLGDANRNILPWQGPFVVFARAIDNVAVRSLTLKANGQDIPLDAAGTATFTFEDWGFQSINATATAVDTNGNITTRTINFDYDFPEGWSGAGTADVPTVAIASPTDTAAVFGMVTITGTASHANFAGYKLSYRRIDETAYTQFFESTTAVVNGTLGVWDTSLLINDEYVILLEAATNAGVVNVVEHNVGLSGDLKLGNFRLAFNDAVVAVAGIPLQIARVYDSLHADRESDFGYGWRLEYRNTDLRVGLPKSGLEDIGIYAALRPGVKVYMNIPGEGRVGFTFNPEIRVLPGLGDNLVLARPRFTADAGVKATLSAGTSGYLLVNEQGELYSSGGIPYNPASPDFGGAYVVTTREGTKYRIDGTSGDMLSATDSNGNQLQFSDSGIVAANGAAQLTFVRDVRGRIVSIVDPAGETLSYRYDGAGDLVSTIDREGHTTSLQYSTSRAHYLERVTDPLGRAGTRSIYGPDGRLTTTLDVNGVATNYSYDPSNSVAVRTNALGHPTIFEYDSRGNLIASTDALGNVARKTYDTQGNLITEIDALGNTTRYEYNSQGDLVATIDPLGQRTSATVNSMGMPLVSTDALGNRSTFQYDTRGNLVASTDAKGNTTRYEVDLQGNVTAVIDPTGIRRTSTYDSAGNVLSQTDGLGNQTTYQYDANGNLIRRTSQLTQPSGTQTANVTFSYDANGKKLSTTNELGQVVSFAYDAAGNQISSTDEAGAITSISYDNTNLPQSIARPAGSSSTFTYNAIGNRTQTTVNGQTTWHEFDAVGRLLAIIYEDDTPSDLSNNPRRRFEYDAAGRETAMIDQRGNRTEYFYDALDRIIRIVNPLGGVDRFTYDAVGNRSQQIDPLGRAISFEFDEAGNISKASYADGSSISYTYDSLGRLVGLKDELARFTQYNRDSEGNLTEVIDATGGKTSYDYDEDDNLISVTDAAGRITKYEYNLLGQQTATVSPLGFRSETQFDLAGNPIQTTDADGRINRNFYDAEGRVIRRELYDGQVVQFSYDTNGQLVSMIDGTGTTSMSYDVQGRLLQRIGGDGRSISYQYDVAGNIVTTSMPGETLNYSYDALGSLTSVQSSTSGLTSYQYDLNRNKVATQFADGTRETRNYDLRDRLVSQSTFNSANSLLQQTSHLLLANGLISSTTESGVSNRQVSYTYDLLNRLLSENVTGASPRSTSYTFDAAGNRLQKTDSVEGTTLYTYDLQDRLLTSILGSQTTTYSYDRSGQLLSEATGADTSTYTYTATGKLANATVVKNGNTETASYKYTGDGLRVSRTSNGVETRYLVDDNRQYSEIAQEYSPAGALLKQYIYGEQIISVTHGGQNNVLHTDHLGSVRFVTANGVVTGSSTTDSFGNVLQTSGNAAELPGFAGRNRDSVTGLIDMRARDYSGAVGRFTTSDPFPAQFDHPGTIHRYAFALNNPVNFSDPSGFFTLAEQLTSTGLGSELMKTYSKNLGKMFLTVLRVSVCVIKPGNQMRTMGAELMAQGVPRGEVLFENGTQMVAAGLNEISQAIKQAYKDIYDDLRKSTESKYKNFGKRPSKPQPKNWLDEMEDYVKDQKKDFLKKGIKDKFKKVEDMVTAMRGYVDDITVMLTSNDICDKAKIAERRGAEMLSKYFDS